jgi:Uma2 family endonuclease
MHVMTEAARRRPTFEELYRQIEALPQGITGQILEPGVLTTMSRPGVPHEWGVTAIEECLRGFSMLRGGAGWWFLREMEIRFPDERLAVPDLSGWRVERIPELPHDNPMVIIPDFCCEVLSPTTARQDRMLKLPMYAACGVRWTWLVDPALRTVEVYESDGTRPVRVAGGEDTQRIALPPFGVETELARLWPRPDR